MDKVLATLTALPVDPTTWQALSDTLDSFETRLRQATQQKRHEFDTLRQAQERAALQQVLLAEHLGQLCSLPGEWLAFFELDDAYSWRAEQVSADQLEAVAQTVDDLQQTIRAHFLVREHVAQSLSEQRHQRNELDLLEKKFEVAHLSLRQVFPSAPPPPLTEPAPAAVQERPTVAPSEAPAVPPPAEWVDADPPTPPQAEPPAPQAEPVPTPPQIEPTPTLLEEEPLPEEEPPPTPMHLPWPGSATQPPSSPVDETSWPPPPAAAEPDWSVTPPSSDRTGDTGPLLPLESGSEPYPVLPVDTAPEVELPSWPIEAQTRFLWERLSQGDVAAAYWVCRSLAAQSPTDTPIDPELLAAVQGAWWLEHERGLLVQDLVELGYAYKPGEELTDQILATAAALLPSLTAPETGLASWLEPERVASPAFGVLVEAIREFSYQSKPLWRDMVTARKGTALHQQQLDSKKAAAREWLSSAPLRRPGFKRATDVWRRWAGVNGRLRTIIELVATGDPTKAPALRRAIGEWRERAPQDWIDLTDAECTGRVPSHNRRIAGPVRDYLINYAEETVQLAEGWLALIQDDSPESDRFLERIDTLVGHLAAHQHAAQRELEEMQQTATVPVAVTLRVLQMSLRSLLSFLNVEGGVPSNGYPVQSEVNLYAGLRHRLLLVPEVGIGDNVRDDPEHLDQLVPLLDAAAERTSAEALEIFIKRHDFRFGNVLIHNLDDGQASAARSRLDEAKAHVQAYLAAQLRQIGDAIEQAVVDNLIDDTQRAELIDELETARGTRSENYNGVLRRLDSIRLRLAQARDERRALQQVRWEKVVRRLEQSGLPSRRPDDYAELTAFIEQLLAQNDIVVVDERLARLEEVLDEGEGDPQREEFFTPRDPDPYQEFVALLDPWSREDALRLFKPNELLGIRSNEGRIPSLLQITALPKPRRQELEGAIQSWHRLKQQGHALGRTEVQDHVVALLRDYLGFTLSRPTASEVVSWRGSGQDWAYLTIQMSAGGLSPLPQFGSLHSPKFDVVVLWERPSAETIGARLHNLRLETNNILVIYLGGLSRKGRLAQLHHNWQSNLSLLILDQFLLLYLARLRTARLPVFFRCALPLARLNPYVETGPVAAEMFKGREDELKGVLDPGGYALVYGGRQLGKSALLQEAERRFHHPEDDRYAQIVDIRNIGDPVSQYEAQPELIWERLQASLVKLGLLNAAGKPEKVLEQIATMMRGNPTRRLLVLFDEADNFLAADQQRNFELVSQLKRLVTETNQRFKIIFAGLHNVQRYENVPNQPLAHLPTLEVRPLEPRAARRLIVEPLEALGFRFRDETPILGILAYSNSHPGLIQLLCHRLLDMLHRQRPSRLGPLVIKREDIEAVYRQREIQEGIRKRFEWTLALDPRYKALAEVMVLEQLQERDSFARTFSAPELREISRSYWPGAFDSADLNEFRGYLNEMVGLGVLVRTQDNEYRLRSPNLVRLMGSPDDILASLSEVTNKTITPVFDPDSHRAPLDVKTMSRYCPFTFGQSRALSTREFGVGLIFGSSALGIDYAAQAIRTQLVNPERAEVREIRLTATGGAALRQWLEQALQRVPDDRGSLAYRFIGGTTAEALAEQVRAALDFAHQHHRLRQRWMRVLLIFDEAATLEWFRLPPAVRAALEKESGDAIMLRKWNHITLEQRLQQHGKMAVERNISRLQNELGGWPWLLDQLADSWGEADDPLRNFDALVKRLRDGDLRQPFLAATGCLLDKTARTVLQAFVHYDIVPVGDAVPGVLDDTLSPEACQTYVDYLQRLGLVEFDGESYRPDLVIGRLLPEP